MQMRGPAMSPNIARPRGIRPDRYKDQPVPAADNEAGTEHERPIANRNQRRRVVDQRSGSHATGLVVQRDDRKVADDADRDKRAFHETRGHISERKDFEPP